MNDTIQISETDTIDLVMIEGFSKRLADAFRDLKGIADDVAARLANPEISKLDQAACEILRDFLNSVLAMDPAP